MKLKVINPNTTLSMTRKIGEAASVVARPGTEILAVSPAMGPASIEGHYDEAVSALGVLDEVRKGTAEGCEGYLIACFDDPGLRAAREIANGPVVGIAEAAITWRPSSAAASLSWQRSIAAGSSSNISFALTGWTMLAVACAPRN